MAAVSVTEAISHRTNSNGPSSAVFCQQRLTNKQVVLGLMLPIVEVCTLFHQKDAEMVVFPSQDLETLQFVPLIVVLHFYLGRTPQLITKAIELRLI